MNEVLRPEVVEKEAMSLIAQAKAVQIVDANTYKTAMEYLPKIKAARNVVKTVFGSVADQAHDTWKAALAVFQKFDKPLEEVEKRIKKDGGDWQYQEQQKAEAERRKLEEEARKEEERKQKEIAAQLKKSGQKELAKAVLAQPIVVAPVEVKEPPKVEGVSFRENWSAQVVDIKALIKYVAGNPSMINLVLPNMPALNSMARGMKANMAIPGVKAVVERGVASRQG